MGFVFIWFVLSILTAFAAGSRGRSAIGWFFLTMIFSPLISIILILLLPNLRQERLLREQMALISSLQGFQDTPQHSGASANAPNEELGGKNNPGWTYDAHEDHTHKGPGVAIAAALLIAGIGLCVFALNRQPDSVPTAQALTPSPVPYITVEQSPPTKADVQKNVWKVSRARKAFSSFPPTVAEVATVSADAPFRGVTASLQIECFTHPELTGLSFGIVLSKAPPNGFMAWRYQYDDQPALKRGPYSRSLPNTSISLGDEELRGLRSARRLKLTLLPADGSELPYEFNVTGAATAIKAIPCKHSP